MDAANGGSTDSHRRSGDDASSSDFIDETMAVYEARADEWHEQRGPSRTSVARRFGARVRRASDPGPVVDLGCGPGWHTSLLGRPVLAIDAARAMLELVPEHAPHAWRVQADLAALPIRRGALGGAWASKSYVHLPRAAMPMALHDLHRALPVGAPIDLHVFAGDLEHGLVSDDEFAGRRFSLWNASLLTDVIRGAGFDVERVVTRRGARDSVGSILVTAVRARTLADTVGPDMRLLLCGLNPSVFAADAGVGFARPGNRFWPAARRAGLVSRERDAVHALAHHGVGMTDLVKRATPRADALGVDEYRLGVERVSRLVSWLRPGAICFVGLAGWRAAVDRRAVAGVQDRLVGGRPVYVMPSTSGLNAATPIDELVEHLRAAATLADGSPIGEA